MKMLREGVRKLFGIFLLIFLTSPSFAATPKENFNNDQLLAQAIRDIDEMQAQELETFIQYMASCSSLKGEAIKDFFCERDRQIYQIKYERGRPLDRVISALAIAKEWMEVLDRTAKPHSEERKELADSVLRRVHLINKLKDAANARFKVLSK